MNLKTVVAAGMLCATPFALAQSVTERNGLLADANGRTLYTFDKDSAGTSNCYDGCAAAWPPFFAAAGASATKEGFSLVTRSDGSKQWAWKSMPLYYYTPDTQPGDALGDGKNGVWHVVRTGKPGATAPQGRSSYGY